MPTIANAIARSPLAQALGPRAGAIAALITSSSLEAVPLGKGITETTPMEVGSLTKPFTALLYAQAIANGEIQPNTRIDQLLCNGTWPGTPITVEHLATHTSGLPRLSIPKWRLPLHPSDPYRAYNRDHLLRYLLRCKPVVPDQPTVAYSNFGYALLGLALEKATGESYEQLLHTRLLAPLHMPATGLHMVTGPNRAERGYRTNTRRTSVWHFDGYAPCGAMVSTLTDLISAARAFLNPTHAIAETLQLTLQPRGAMPGNNIGLAWMLPNGQDWVWHNGATFGYTSYLGFSPARGEAVILLANQFLPKQLTALGHQLMRLNLASHMEKQ